MKCALIIGSEGQDGRIATAQLRREGFRVIGVGRDTIRDTAGIESAVVNISDAESIADLVGRCSPAEIYYLAARHGSSESRTNDDPAELRAMLAVNVEGVANVLEAVRKVSKETRIVYAASSRIFGTPPGEVQSESTPVAPECVYGITKAAGLQLCRRYRREYGLHVSVAILYNHESPFRGPQFVSSRIIRGALAIARGEASELVLGDLDAAVDWGWAPDFVDAMARMARLETSGDFIVATGVAHTVRHFAEAAFRCAGLDARTYLRQQDLLPRRRQIRMIGDSSRLRAATGWSPTLTFEEMVKRLWEAAAKETSDSEHR